LLQPFYSSAIVAGAGQLVRFFDGLDDFGPQVRGH
jgi:hypothetical protein